MVDIEICIFLLFWLKKSGPCQGFAVGFVLLLYTCTSYTLLIQATGPSTSLTLLFYLVLEINSPFLGLVTQDVASAQLGP